MIQIKNLDTIVGMSAYACEVLEAIHNYNPEHYTFILDDKWELNTTGFATKKGKIIVKMINHNTYKDTIAIHVVGWQQPSETLTNKTEISSAVDMASIIAKTIQKALVEKQKIIGAPQVQFSSHSFTLNHIS